MSRAKRFVVWCALSVACGWLAPASAHAQTLAQCKKWSITPNPTQPVADPAADPKVPRPTWILRPDPASQIDYVTIVCDSTQLFADEIDYFESLDLVKARGHVNFLDGDERITADRAEFNIKTKLGSFWGAQGLMGIAGKSDPRSPLVASEADAYFSADLLEVVEKNRFRLTNGRFTTCVQPTPRWEVEGATMEFVKDRRTREPNGEATKKLVKYCYERGLILMSAGTYGNNIRLLPPLTIEPEVLREGLDLIEQGLKEISG